MMKDLKNFLMVILVLVLMVILISTGYLMILLLPIVGIVILYYKLTGKWDNEK